MHQENHRGTETPRITEQGSRNQTSHGEASRYHQFGSFLLESYSPHKKTAEARRHRSRHREPEPERRALLLDASHLNAYKS